MTTKRWDVFVSYASEDRVEVALPLKRALEARHVKVWIDQHELSLGDSLRSTIGKGLRDKGRVIVAGTWELCTVHVADNQRFLDNAIAWLGDQ